MVDNNKQCPENHYSYIIKAGDTLYEIAQNYSVNLSSIMEANPGINPNYLRVGQRICIPPAAVLEQPDCQLIIASMQSDINMLKKESSAQQIEEENYRNSKKKTTNVTKLTANEIQFDAVSVVFTGDYRGIIH